MKKINKKTVILGLVSLGLASCSDVDDEITSLKFSRNLSPIEFEAKNVSETTANLQWKYVEGATSYVIEVYADDSLAFNGNPEKTITTANNTTSLSGLLFDTKYSARVQAKTDSDDSRDSKWTSVFFRTSAKQFMKNLKPNDIADRSVIISWEPEEGFDVTTIVIGSITHEITAEEKEAGKATIEGLDPETTYTAYLYYNGKLCGNRSFTTIADLNGAILVHEGDNLASIIAEADANATIAVYGGTYVLNPNDEEKAGAAKVNNTITIKGIYPTDQPIIKGRFELYGGAGLTMSQVILDGADNATGDQTFNYKDATDYAALDIQNVEIRNYTKGICYGNVNGTIESISFNKCLIHDIKCDGGDFFDIRKNYVKNITFKSSTIYNCAQERDFIRYDDSSTNYTDAAPVITIDQCTIDNCCNVANNKRLLYVRFVGNSIKWTNNLVTNTKAIFTNQSKTGVPTFGNNAYFNAENLKAVVEGGNLFTDDTATWLTASPYSEASPVFTYNEDNANKGWGDQRWK